MLTYRKKRAIMGIGTLIIFIATILVAAVAAGVLISTSGVLQQRALITGQEARKKITNAIEIISISSHGNKTSETLNDFEILIRLDAGSDPVHMNKFDVSYIGPEHDASGYLSRPSLNDPEVDETGFSDEIELPLTNGTPVSIRDLDGDGQAESMYLYTVPTQQDTQQLIINFTDSDAGDFEHTIVTGASYPEIVNQSDVHIEGEDGFTYGFLQIHVTLQSNDTIDEENSSITMTANFLGDCSFENLAPETKFCYIVMHGDTDEVLGEGEVFKVLYKLRPDHVMGLSEEFRFIFTSEKGRLTSATARTPDIIQTSRVPLWPVG